jgi:hypothetical protein
MQTIYQIHPLTTNVYIVGAKNHQVSTNLKKDLIKLSHFNLILSIHYGEQWSESLSQEDLVKTCTCDCEEIGSLPTTEIERLYNTELGMVSWIKGGNLLREYREMLYGTQHNHS